jgi:hypothetical protein
MTVFVDTPVFMRNLLKQPGALMDWSLGSNSFERTVAAVLNRAADPFPTVLGTPAPGREDWSLAHRPVSSL